MMNLLLTILSIVIKVLLIIFLILIIFLLLPFRYKFSAKYEDKIFLVKFSYLILVFNLVVDFSSKFKFKITFMHKTLVDSEKKKENNEDKDAVKDSSFENKNLLNEVTDDKMAIKSLKNDAIRFEKEIIENIDSSSLDDGNQKNRIEKILSIFNPFFDFVKKVFSDDFSYVIKLIFREVLIVLKHILPKQIKLDAEFGQDDPYIVGKILTYITPLYVKYGDKIKVKPHFDKEIFKLNLCLYGYPQLIYMLILVIKLFLDKKFRNLFFKKKLVKGK